MGQAILRKLTANVLMVLCLFSLSTPFMLQNYSTNHFNQPQTNDSNRNDIWDDTSNNKIKLDYTPIESFAGSGDNLTIDDNLGVYHSVNISLDSDNSYSDSYSITAPTGYTADDLQYNLTLESAVNQDEYQVIQNKNNEQLSSTRIRYAFKFDVSTSYAIFKGAQIWFDLYGGSYGTDEMELFLVEETALGFPNMSAILANDIDDPYNDSNHFPSSSVGNLAYFEFSNSVLSSGSYFVVANLSSYDASDSTGIAWMSQQISSTRVYYHDGSVWNFDSPHARTLTFISHLQESDVSGNPLTYSDPTVVNLRDNGAVVSTLDQTINSTGVHTLTSDVAVIVKSNNSYQFTRNYIGTSVFEITNSTYNEFSNVWTISWNISVVNLGIFSNPSRTQSFSIPSDWNKTSFVFLYNDLTPIMGSWISDGYEYDLAFLHSINQYDGGDFEFTITSSNYIISTSLNDENFELGYWTNNGTHAFGHEGSIIFSTANIENILISGGSLNFSIFDDSGNILPLKSSIPSNLIYVDNSSYTKDAYIDGSLYKSNITVDPSVYGTDVEGYWTVFFYWSNGTEVGLFTKTITIVKSTLAEFFVEEVVGGDWIEISSTEITRMNGDEINIKASYYNISDPFFSGLGGQIPAGDVYYSTSWSETNNLIFDSGNYSYGLSPNITEGNYLIDLYAEGPFLQSHSAQFSLILLHQFQLRVHQPQTPVNYTDDSVVIFALEDITNGSVLISPDSITISVNGTVLAESSEYDYSIVNSYIVITIHNKILEYLPANYELELTVSKTNFVESIGVEQTSITSIYKIQSVALTSISPITTITETNISSQITLSFEWIDETHSEQIKGATVVVTLDISEPGVEIIENSENDGIYTIIIRINEPEIKTLNVRVTATKEGYDSVLNFILATISIKTPSLPPTTPPPTTPTNGGLPIGLIIALSLVAVAGLGVGAFFVTRTQMSKRKEEHEVHKSKARAIFQSAFMIKRVLVVHHETSSPIYEYSLDDRAELDPSIISGVLQAISSIGAEMSGARTGIKKIEYYNFVVTSASSGAYTAYIFSDTELEGEFEQGLDNLVRWFDVIFGYEGAQWEGSMDIFNEYKESINEKVVEELFLWFMFPLQVPSKTLEELNKLKTIDQEIVSFVNGKGKATTALIMDQLDEHSNEDILERIMTLVKEEKLKTNNTDAATSIT